MKFALQCSANFGIARDGPDRFSDGTLEVGRQVSKALGHGGRDGDPVSKHYRARFLGCRSGTPNTSSKESPLPPLAK